MKRLLRDECPCRMGGSSINEKPNPALMSNASTMSACSTATTPRTFSHQGECAPIHSIGHTIIDAQERQHLWQHLKLKATSGTTAGTRWHFTRHPIYAPKQWLCPRLNAVSQNLTWRVRCDRLEVLHITGATLCVSAAALFPTKVQSNMSSGGRATT
jgi:hypothetical protein